MAQIQIRLSAIGGDKDFAMLDRAHSSRIYIDVGSIFNVYAQISGQVGQQGMPLIYPFPEETTTGHKNKTCHGLHQDSSDAKWSALMTLGAWKMELQDNKRSLNHNVPLFERHLHRPGIQPAR